LKFGIHMGLAYTNTSELKETAQHVEALGFDWISIFDHMYSSNGTSDRHSHEAVAMHTFLATVTSKITCGCLVYVAAYRSPGMLAKSMSTVDQISHGRIVIGLGAGWNRREFSSLGIPFLSPAERSIQLGEYFQIVHSLLNDRRPVTFSGRYFQIHEAVCEPQPVQKRIPLWIGGVGEKQLLPLAAKLADGWNAPYVSPQVFRTKRDRLAENCSDAGRDIGSMTCSVNVGMARSEADLRGQYGRRADEVRHAVLMGSFDQIRDLIGQYQDAGADQLNISIRATKDRQQGSGAYDLDGLSELAAILPMAEVNIERNLYQYLK
jgi:probable F420-dependent oxidoreductase